MTTLCKLKKALKDEAVKPALSTKLPLTDTQYSLGFQSFMRGEGWKTYQEFIVPQLTRLLIPLLSLRKHLAVLEVGPGPTSLFGHLPENLRKKIRRYSAFEPNALFAAELEKFFSCGAKANHSFPNLEGQADIRRFPFVPDDYAEGYGSDEGAYDVILFCHSMHGMNPKHRFIETTLRMLTAPPTPSVVVVFHRDGTLDLNGLVCQQTISHPSGAVSVKDSDVELDNFASFIVGHVVQTEEAFTKWRDICRKLGRRGKDDPGYLWFRSPEVMVAFNQYANQLSKLMGQVPFLKDNKVTIKNCEAQAHRPAAVFRPTELQHIQQCIRWAIEHEFGLTVLGGGHSGHCIRSNVVSIDMSAFSKVFVLAPGDGKSPNLSPGGNCRVFIEAGCKTGDIIRETMKVGATLPLGSRPNVGAGMWLQGGIGHLSRMYGLASDTIVGAVIVSVHSARIFCVGQVPSEHWPTGAARPPDELDLLWAIKGAGTNFGVVVGVCCTISKAPTFLTQDWIVPLVDKHEARQKLNDFDALVAKKLPLNCSADAYLYCDDGRLHLGVTLFEAYTDFRPQMILTQLNSLLGPGSDVRALNNVELFDVDLYVSKMHGGHAGGKTSSFKRCLFLQNIERSDVVDLLSAALENRPTPLCYLHLIQGGGAVDEIEAKATAFGCRGWHFACVVTAVWPRDFDGTNLALSAMDWVYKVVHDLFPLSIGVYGADLGPDPRDASLAARAFGPNLARLAHLKHNWDPYNILSYACPIPKVKAPKLIVLVTGKSCAGKDYCAGVWASLLARCLSETFVVKVASISDVTKQEYAEATGADLSRLHHDRAYKEHHRPGMSKFFQDEMQSQPDLPKEHFMNVVYGTDHVDVLFITGMREEAPVATMSPLVPDSRMLDINVQLDEKTRQTRRGCVGQDDGDDKIKPRIESAGPATVSYQPYLVFRNDSLGKEEAERFAERRLLPLFHEDLQRLKEMTPSVKNFPSFGIHFRNVLGISQQSDGLRLCTSLLQEHFVGDWSNVGFVAACESGGFICASALALQTKVPMITIREAGKLPPPTLSVDKSSSHIKSLASTGSTMKRIEMQRDVIPSGASVVVVDDVLATGETLCAVLRLLDKAGVCAENISVLVVAEFPLHGGRKLLYQHGFGKTIVQSLLVFDGA